MKLLHNERSAVDHRLGSWLPIARHRHVHDLCAFLFTSWRKIHAVPSTNQRHLEQSAVDHRSGSWLPIARVEDWREGSDEGCRLRLLLAFVTPVEQPVQHHARFGLRRSKHDSHPQINRSNAIARFTLQPAQFANHLLGLLTGNSQTR